MTDWFRPLKEKDIEEKIQIEIKAGHDIKTVKELLKLELFDHEREILKAKQYLTELRFFKFIFKYRKIMKALLPLEIQAQNLREQIAYVDKKIIAEKEK